MADMTRLWYLIWLSKKYGLDTRKFLMCFPDAWAHEKSLHNGISIQLRQETENNCVFLVTQDQKPADLAELTGVKCVLISSAMIAKIADQKIREKYPNVKKSREET